MVKNIYIGLQERFRKPCRSSGEPLLIRAEGLPLLGFSSHELHIYSHGKFRHVISQKIIARLNNLHVLRTYSIYELRKIQTLVRGFSADVLKGSQKRLLNGIAEMGRQYQRRRQLFCEVSSPEERAIVPHLAELRSMGMVNPLPLALLLFFLIETVICEHGNTGSHDPGSCRRRVSLR